ncbi:Serine/arginine-rich splicing factor 7 [Triticum urartu]|uniref:Serine/arginine-rich splicing factor 7 n=1 Tax=Triticum urartu TaxID=4572 RepID=M8AD72_TRIUA|nr:Serine/arginine-rich splicing factor 7 [Triticum urartu]
MALSSRLIGTVYIAVAWFSYWIGNLGFIIEENTYRNCVAPTLPYWGNTDVVQATSGYKLKEGPGSRQLFPDFVIFLCQMLCGPGMRKGADLFTMARLYVGNLDARVTAGELEDEFRVFGVLRSVWVARKPPGFAFIDFDDKRDAEDALRDLDGKNGWRVELSRNDRGDRGGRGGGGGGGRDRGGSDMKCYECGESGHFARECRLRIGAGGLGSGRRRSRSRSRSHSPRDRRSPSYGRRSYSPRDRSPRRRSASPAPARGRSYSKSPVRARDDSPDAKGPNCLPPGAPVCVSLMPLLCCGHPSLAVFVSDSPPCTPNLKSISSRWSPKNTIEPNFSEDQMLHPVEIGVYGEGIFSATSHTNQKFVRKMIKWKKKDM